LTHLTTHPLLRTQVFPSLYIRPIRPPDVFSFTLGRPPSSTLFPYTTLFRSHPQAVLAAGLEREGPGVALERRLGGGHAASIARQDRKSTRLNSSHGSTSYAVFSL